MKRSLAIATGIVGVCVVGAAALYKSLSPHISMSSHAAAEAVIPPEVKMTTPTDQPAQERCAKLIEAAKAFDEKGLSQIANQGLPSGSERGGPELGKKPAPPPIGQQYEQAMAFWRANRDNLDRLANALDAGPVQFPRSNAFDASFKDIAYTKAVIKALAITADLAAAKGDFDTATKQLTLATKFDERTFASGAVKIDYLVSVALDAIVAKAIQKAAAEPGFPASKCAELLRVFTPAPRTDTFLRDAIRTDFQHYMLKFIETDPRDNKELAADFGLKTPESDERQSPAITGTYDEVATAKLAGEAVIVTMQNATRPYSEVDQRGLDTLNKLASKLPKEVDTERPEGFGKWWDGEQYRFQMNRMENSIGVTIASALLDQGEISALSCNWRAMHEATRVLLASRIFRASHNGALPSSVDDFKSILGLWPTDPFNGQPMHYSQKLQAVYSVGKNLQDDHGDIGTNPYQSADVGISLAMK